MKTICNRIYVKGLFTAVLFFLSIECFSQPDYTFKNPTLIAGSDRQIGAQYRFKKIKPGVDGLITIVDIKKVTLDELDGSGGFAEAFQPAITVPRKSNGYVEFQLDFVQANTTIPVVMIEVPLTAIDIDGYIYPDEKVYEYDEFQTTPVFYINYDFMGSSLDVQLQGSWYQAINKTAVDYPGIDTVQKDVMFSMVYAGVTSISFRVGANNKSNTSTRRLRSVYFQKFTYPNSSVLSQSPIINFNGKKERNSIDLNWEFAGEGIKAYSLERSVNGRGFTAITTAMANPPGDDQSYNYSDFSAGSDNYAYRLKVEYLNGKAVYSQVIFFRDSQGSTDKMTIYPNIIQSQASVQVNSAAAMNSTLQVVDYSGRVMLKIPVQLSKGANSLYLDVSGKLAKGNYLVVLPLDGTRLTQKIVVN